MGLKRALTAKPFPRPARLLAPCPVRFPPDPPSSPCPPSFSPAQCCLGDFVLALPSCRVPRDGFLLVSWVHLRVRGFRLLVLLVPFIETRQAATSPPGKQRQPSVLELLGISLLAPIRPCVCIGVCVRTYVSLQTRSRDVCPRAPQFGETALIPPTAHGVAERALAAGSLSPVSLSSNSGLKGMPSPGPHLSMSPPALQDLCSSVKSSRSPSRVACIYLYFLGR